MKSIQNSFELNIEKKLSDFLENKSIDEWCDQVASDFMFETQQKKPPFNFGDSYLKKRKVTLVTNSKSITVRGKMDVIKEGFIIEINPSIKNEFQYRFTLAHELAHTFFYDYDYRPPRDLSGFSVGSKYIEFLCNKVARNILVPRSSLEETLKSFLLPSDKNFELSTINELSTLYKVTYSVMLSRLITDLEIWKCILLRFKCDEEGSWRIIETYKPKSIFYDKNYFIPNGNRIKNVSGEEKYPSAKKDLNILLREIEKELRRKNRCSLNVKKSILNNPPISTFVTNHFLSEKVFIHTSMQYNSGVINVCIPL